LPEPWAATVEASVRLIDEVDREIDGCEAELRRLGADHRYVPLLLTIPVFFHCVTMIGFETPDLRVAVHSIAGSFVYGVLAAKLLVIRWKGYPHRVLPVLGGSLASVLSMLSLTSALWYFTNVRFGF
jgi:Family of unknown function (DUF6529)